MPFVHIKSLPLAGRFEPREAVRAISRDFASSTGTDERHLTVTWQILDPEHYSHAGRTAPSQTADSHPMLVKVLAPELNAEDRIEGMLAAAARAVASQAGVDPENVFVEFRAAQSGRVFDGGEVVRW